VIRIPTVNIDGSVKTDTVTFQLAGDWQTNEPWRLGTSPFRIEEFSEIGLPPELSPDNHLELRAWLDVEKARVTMSNFELSKGGRLSIFRVSPAAVSLLSGGAPFRGRAHLLDEATMLGGDGGSLRQRFSKSVQFAVPAAIPFFSDGKSNIPAQLRFGTADRIVFRDIPVRALSFSREGIGNLTLPVFISGITSGSITIGETNEKITLGDAERLSLGPMDGFIHELEIGPRFLRLSFHGKSSAVSIGSGVFEQNLVPTWVSYLYHQQQLGFFWGAVVFLWSMLWSARQILFK
jgi:hypothetical protein